MLKNKRSKYSVHTCTPNFCLCGENRDIQVWNPLSTYAIHTCNNSEQHLQSIHMGKKKHKQANKNRALYGSNMRNVCALTKKKSCEANSPNKRAQKERTKKSLHHLQYENRTMSYVTVHLCTTSHRLSFHHRCSS